MTVYKASVGDRIDSRGVHVWMDHGQVTPCGEWVERGNVRVRRTPEWHETKQQAEAVAAGEIARLGSLLISQSAELLNRATAEATA
jgi:hypothetical protein